MSVRPVRLQLSRRKGFNLQALSRETNGLEAVNVARPSRWGNPCRVGRFRGYGAVEAVSDFRRWLDRDLSVRSFENVYGRPPTIECVRAELAGRNLACWCPLPAAGEPDICHAAVLLELANPLPEKPRGEG